MAQHASGKGGAPDIKGKQQQQEHDNIKRIAQINYELRQAISKALPAPPEQFLTVMVPGKVVNFADHYYQTNENGLPVDVVMPARVELANARLCDDMPALASIQLGPTGRSVARSYEATLSKLIPKGTTIGLEVSDPAHLTEQEKRYNKAMEWLCAKDPDAQGKTRVEMYVEKQHKYTKAVEAKLKAFDDALVRATKDPLLQGSVEKQRAAYDTWVNEHQRTYRNHVSAAYMDWVIHGKKEAVEYWFAIVDVDSAISRVESSKEAMRASVVSDVDGAAEFYKVQCTPSNWAEMCWEKMRNPEVHRTPEWYAWEIGRLQKINSMLRAIKTAGNPSPTSEPPATDQTSTETQKHTEEYIKLRNDAHTAKDGKGRKETATKLAKKREELAKAHEEHDKASIHNLTGVAQKASAEKYAAMAEHVTEEITANEAKIKNLEEELKVLISAKLPSPAEALAQETAIEPPQPDPGPAPTTTTTTSTTTTTTTTTARTPPTAARPKQSDFWTTVSCEVSSSYKHEEAETATSSTSVGASGGWGGFSAGGSGSHSDASADLSSQMANSSIKVSFDCMRVDIERSWLRTELFYDDDLAVAPGNAISPGPVEMASLLDPGSFEAATNQTAKQKREDDLQKYSMFPMYPTAFLLAANVVLEISGDTASITSHFHTSTTTATASAGWGPFQVSASHSSTKTQSSSTCETTASGCRITIHSPQIIGWISEIVPALPRKIVK